MNIYKHLGISPIDPQPSQFASLLDYQNCLIKSHMPLVAYLENLLLTRFPGNRLCPGDLASCGYEALVKAARTFKRVGQFLPYAYDSVKNAMYGEIRRLFPVNLGNAYKSEDGFCYQEVFIDTAFDTHEELFSDNDEDYVNEQERIAYLNQALNRLPQDDRDFIMDNYGFDGKAMTLEQLGKRNGTSPQAAWKKKNRILRTMLTYSISESLYRECA